MKNKCFLRLRLGEGIICANLAKEILDGLKMKICKGMCFIVSAGAVLLAGCAKEQQFEAIEEICVSSVSREAAIETAEKVLGQMHFVIDKADAAAGYIRTRPLQGGQWFEFWREDNVGARNAAEANLHSIRRTVELDMSEKGGELCVGCEVHVQRLSLGERQVSSTARAYKMFSESSRSKQKLKLYSNEKAWIDLGKDDKLATEILKRLKEKMAKTL